MAKPAPSARVAKVAAEIATAQHVNEWRSTQLSLDSLIDVIPTGLAIILKGGRVVAANPAFHAIYGSDDRRIDSKHDFPDFLTWWVSTGRSVQPDEWPAMRAMRSGRTVHGKLMRIRRFNGRLGYLLSSATPLRAASGTLLGAVVSARDVTDAVLAQRTEFGMSRIYRTILSVRHPTRSIQSVIARCVTMLDAKSAKVKLQVSKSLGLSRSAFEHRPDASVDHPFEVFDLSVPIRIGRRRVGELMLEGLQDPHGAKGRALHTATAVSQALGILIARTQDHADLLSEVASRRRSQRALRESHRMLESRIRGRTKALETSRKALVESQRSFREMAEHVQDAFWLAAPDLSRMHYVSPAYERIWGQPVERVYRDPRNWSRAVHPLDRGHLRSTMLSRQLRTQEDMLKSQYRIIRPDGTVRWVYDQGWAIRDPSGKITRIAGLSRDITDQHEMEARLLRATEEERERIARDLHDGLGQALAGVGYFGSGLLAKLSATRSPLARDLRHLMGMIGRATRQAHDLVEGLMPLDIARQGIARALADLAAHTDEWSAVRCRYEGPGTLNGVPGEVALQLFRIAQEAVSNAVRHARAEWVRIILRRTRYLLSIEVRDNGRGISRRREKGMGLRIMQHRADVLGARFNLKTGPSGTSIHCAIPRGHA